VRVARSAAGADAVPLVEEWTAHAPSAVSAVAYAPQARLLASASRDVCVKLWSSGSSGSGGAGGNGASGSGSAREAAATLRGGGHAARISGLAITDDGTLLATGSRDTRVAVWDVARSGSGGAGAGAAPLSLTPRGAASLQQNVVTSLAWADAATCGMAGAGSPLLVQGGEDLRVRLWDSRAGLLREVLALTG
jgi:WD40 repeat protein